MKTGSLKSGVICRFCNSYNTYWDVKEYHSYLISRDPSLNTDKRKFESKYDYKIDGKFLHCVDCGKRWQY